MIPTLIASAATITGLSIKSYLETRTLITKPFSFKTKHGGPTQKIAFLTDLHFHDDRTIPHLLTLQATETLKEWRPDVIIYGGDYVTRWTETSPKTVQESLSPLADLNVPTLAILGNHDYYKGQPESLNEVFQKLNINLLRNQSQQINGVTYTGLDSSHQEQDELKDDVISATPNSRQIIIWHEPDAVDRLPNTCTADLMIAGHTHGGQLLNPWGWGELSSKNGKKYNRGFFENTPIPLYVSCGIGTVGVHARLFAPPELTLITLD